MSESYLASLRQRLTRNDLRDALDYWCRIRGDRAIPRRQDLDPLDIPRLLPLVSLVDVVGDPPDFRFRLIGENPAKTHIMGNGDSAFDLPEHAGREQILDRYRRCLAARLPVAGTYEHTSSDHRIWRVDALTCPLSENDRDINMLLSFGAGQLVGSRTSGALSPVAHSEPAGGAASPTARRAHKSAD